MFDHETVHSSWEQKVSADAAKYGIPNPVVGARFTFFTEERLLQGTIVGMEYGDDGLPFLQVSPRMFAGDKVTSLYPTQTGTWKLITIYGRGDASKSYTEGVVRFE
jgi:hypothetical protein